LIANKKTTILSPHPDSYSNSFTLATLTALCSFRMVKKELSRGFSTPKSSDPTDTDFAATPENKVAVYNLDSHETAYIVKMIWS